MKRLIAVFCFLMMSSCCFAQNIFEQGKAEYKKANYAKAEKLFLQELQQNPNNYSCRYYLAHTYVYNNKPEKAKIEYGKIITFSPTPDVKKLAMRSLANLNRRQSERIYQLVTREDNYYDLIMHDGRYIRWAEFPVKVFIQEDETKNLIRGAFETWSKAVNGLVSFIYVNDVEQAQIEVYLVDSLPREVNVGFAAGLTTFWGKDDFFTKAKIELLRTFPDTKEKIPPGILGTVALHEIGHSLGLQGHSNNPNDVMYEVNRKGEIPLTKRDLYTLKMLYEF